VTDKIARAEKNTGKAKKAKPKKNPEKPLTNWRLGVQIAFSALCIWIGIEFHFFVEYLGSGGETGSAYRPPGVEGFLPISSLMSLYYWTQTGVIHFAHPAGLFILIAILAISIVFGKTFCSWLCPVGFISEMLGDFAEKVTGKRLKLPAWLDYPLRSLKYLLLAFFVYSIFFLMTAASLKAFLDSPYNLIADVKMYYFFADITRVSLMVIASLFVLSLLIRNFWCRFLCPYGALLGLLNFISPNRIKRNEQSCIDCGKCAKVCPSFIKVDQVKAVWSDECTTCVKCVDVCPVADTLEFRTVGRKKPIDKRLVAAVVVVGFMAITGLGMISGYWSGGVSTEEYLHHHQYKDAYGHPTGTSEIEELNEEAEAGK